MAPAGLHDARQDGDDGELRDAERQDPQREPYEGPEGDGLLLFLLEDDDVTAITVLDGQDGEGDGGPDAYLWLGSGTIAFSDEGSSLKAHTHHRYHDQPVVGVELVQNLPADIEAGGGEGRAEDGDGDDGRQDGRALVGGRDLRRDVVGHCDLLRREAFPFSSTMRHDLQGFKT